MKKAIKYLSLAIVALLACVSFSSCGSDDDEIDKGIGNYYFQLMSVETNLVDAANNNMERAIRSEWITANHADAEGRVQIGKMDSESAREWFYQTIGSLTKEFAEAYQGKNSLPENGYIVYHFGLKSDNVYTGANEFATIQVTEQGAVERY